MLISSDFAVSLACSASFCATSSLRLASSERAMELKACVSAPISPGPSSSSRVSNSPVATRLASATTRRTGRAIQRDR
jgi:hypothetical protein